MTEQQEYIDGLIERETHSDTMRALSPLEQQHLADWRAHFETPGYTSEWGSRALEINSYYV